MNAQNVLVTPETKPLDEARWQAWVAKGREQDLRAKDARLAALKWISILGLLAAAILWSEAEPYQTVIRFIVTGGAIAVMVRALQDGRLPFAAVFTMLAIVFNPVVPIFQFSGVWQRALLVASAAPFVASLAWSEPRLATS